MLPSFTHKSILCFSPQGLFQQPDNKIIGGFVVPEDSAQFKFTVQVVFRKFKHESVCGGSLISPNYVLTAAHCMDGSESVKVIHFEPLIKKNTTYEVSHILSHPKFEYSAFFTLYDFAILKLKNPVKGKKIFACLPNNELETFVGANVTISGWGRTDPNAQSNYDVLKSGFVTAVLNSDCSKTYERTYNKYLQKKNPGAPHVIVRIPQTIICVDGHITKTTPCNGDSGGNTLMTGVLKFFCIATLFKIFLYHCDPRMLQTSMNLR